MLSGKDGLAVYRELRAANRQMPFATGNLDEQTSKAIFDLSHQLSRPEETIIAVTHDISIAGQTDQAFVFSDGKLRSVKR